MFRIKISSQNKLFSNSIKDFNEHLFGDPVSRRTVNCSYIGFFIIVDNRDYSCLYMVLTDLLLWIVLNGLSDEYSSSTMCSTTRVQGPIALVTCYSTVVFISEVCFRD